MNPAFKKRNPLIIILFLSIALVNFFSPLSTGSNDREALQDRAVRMDIPSAIPDSQFLAYKRTVDSLENTRTWKKERVTPWLDRILDLLVAGIGSIRECDTCKHPDETTTIDKYFLSFKGFALKKNASFFIEGNDYFIEKTITHGKTAGPGNTEKKKTDVRLAARDDENGLTLLIPVSRGVFPWLEIVMHVLLVAGILAALYFFLLLPIRVLRNIGKGQPFTPRNIKDLHGIGWAFIIASFIVTMFPLLVPIIFPSVPGEIYYSFPTVFHKNIAGFFLGIIVLIIAGAFKQGYKLQQEQELTV